MIGLIIVMTFVCIILLLLLSSLKITFNICDGVDFRVSFLGISLFSLKENKPVKNKSEKSKGKSKLTNTLKEYSKGKSRKLLVEEILFILKELCVKFVKLLKHIRFKKLDFNLIVASDDAAKTAIRYGKVCSVVYSICGMLGSAKRFNAKKIKVSTDFSSEQMTLILKSTIKIRLLFLVGFAVSTAFSIIKLKLGEVKNGRS